MNAIAMTCPWCGAPLPERALNESASQPFVRCTYCSATSDLGGAHATHATHATKAEPAAASPLQLFSDASFLQVVATAFEDARRGGASAHDALVATAHAHLAGMQGEAFARVCLALAREFDASHGTNTADDGKSIARLINAYLLAIESIRTSGDYQVNLPFFAVTPAGLPVHLERTLTADAIAELAQRTATVASDEPSSVAPKDRAEGAVGPSPKKWRFWPFGG